MPCLKLKGLFPPKGNKPFCRYRSASVQPCPEGNLSRCRHIVKLDQMRSVVHIHFEHCTLAKHQMPDPLTNREHSVTVLRREKALRTRDVVLRFADQPFLRRRGEGEQIPTNIQHKPRRIPRRTVKVTPVRFRKIQPLFRARERHERQPSFLLHSGQRAHLA